MRTTTLLLIAASLATTIANAGCTENVDLEDSAVAIGAQTTSTPLTCTPQSVGGRSVRVFTTSTATMLEIEEARKYVGDPSLFASLQESRTVVLKTDDFAAAKREIRSNVRLWAALFGDERAVPDQTIDLFRSRLADAFVENLHCSEGAPPPASTATAAPICTSAGDLTALVDGARLTIAEGPELATPSAMFPELRFSFDVAYEKAPTPITSSSTMLATIVSRRVLRMERLNAAPSGIESLRQALLTSQLDLAGRFVGSMSTMWDLDATLVCSDRVVDP